jgi:Tfp pilus assembly PilM family ATPase
MSVAAKWLVRTKAHSPIGLDVGRTATRAAQLRHIGRGWSVTLLRSWRASKDTSAAAIDDDAMPRAARWLRQLGGRGRAVVAGLSAPDVELHAMEIPRPAAGSAGEQQRQAARWETERLMSFEAGRANIDFWFLPESRALHTTAIGVAASVERVDAVLRLCGDAKLDCGRIDTTACALSRFGTLWRNQPSGEEEVWGVLDLGARMSRLIVCVAETPVLARAFGHGGISWTERLAHSLTVSTATAEQHKRDHGIALVSRGRDHGCGAAGAPNVVGEMIYSVLRADLDTIVGEVERSYRYVMQCFPRHRTGPLILVGGGANLRNVDALLADKLGIAVVVPALPSAGEASGLDFEPVREQLREPLSNYACAIGLAITAVERHD